MLNIPTCRTKKSQDKFNRVCDFRHKVNREAKRSRTRRVVESQTGLKKDIGEDENANPGEVWGTEAVVDVTIGIFREDAAYAEICRHFYLVPERVLFR